VRTNILILEPQKEIQNSRQIGIKTQTNKIKFKKNKKELIPLTPEDNNHGPLLKITKTVCIILKNIRKLAINTALASYYQQLANSYKLG